MADFYPGEMETMTANYLNSVAERDGLCSNCFHTLACCAGKCGTLSDPEFNEWEHVCVGTPNPKPVGWGW